MNLTRQSILSQNRYTTEILQIKESKHLESKKKKKERKQERKIARKKERKKERRKEGKKER